MKKDYGFGSRALCFLSNKSEDLARGIKDKDLSKGKIFAPRATKKVMGTNLLLSESGLSL